MTNRRSFTSRLPLVGASMGKGLQSCRDFLKLKLGNVILTALPDDREEALDVVRFCREHGIFLMLSEIVQRHNHNRLQCAHLSKPDLEDILQEAGPFFLGRYAVGEAGGMFYWPKSYVIGARTGRYDAMPPCANEKQAHDYYVNYIRKELEFERNEVCDAPLFDVESSLAFSLHDEAGIDGLCLELLPGDPRITLSAIRGTARKTGKLWGVHIAMLWYGGIRMDELWIRRWRSALWTSYLFGAEFIYPESGHLDYHERDGQWFEFDSPELLRVRRELRDLYRFTQVHTRPAAGPEVPVAVLQGQDDGHPGIWNPYAWGQYNNGTEWETSDAEKGWKIFDTLFQREDLFHEHVTGNYNMTGNPPCGQVDVIPVSGDFGPRSPVSGSAHSFQMRTPRSWSHRALVLPCRNHKSSYMMLLRWTFLVVTRGKPSSRLKRIWCPKMLRVPVPVRSDLSVPLSRIFCNRSKYCFILLGYNLRMYRGMHVCRRLGGARWRLVSTGSRLSGGSRRLPVRGCRR